MIFTPAQLKDLTTLCEIGAKVMSQDKPLHESAIIQNGALALLRILHEANNKYTAVEDDKPPVVETAQQE